MIDRKVILRAWRIAWPLIVSEAVSSVLSITDMFFVSRLGDEPVAAVGLAGYASWLFFIITQLFYMGVIVLASQAYGADHLDEASQVAGESMPASLVLAIPMALLGVVTSNTFLALLGGKGRVAVLAAEYFRIRLLALPLVALTMTIGAVFRAVGVTRYVMAASLAGTTVNVFLDPFLIFGLKPFPKLGVVGAAWASVAAQTVNLVLHAAFIGRLPLRVSPTVPGRRAYRALKVGLPPMFERLVFSLGNMAYIAVIARCGREAMAAHTIGIRIESFAYLPAFAMSIAASSLVGHEIGRRDISMAKKVGWEVSKATTLLMVAAGALLVALSPIAPGFFTGSSRIAWLAAIYLVLAAISEPSLGLVMGLAGAIRGAGNTLVPTLVNLVSLYAFRVVPAYLLPWLMPSELRVLGAWLAMDIDLFTRSAIFTLLYKRKFERFARVLTTTSSP